ncbi:MAG: tetratricopeptide repeat-containing protein [Saprospiraceae bacterium]
MLESILNKALGGISDKVKSAVYDKLAGTDKAEILEIRNTDNKTAILFLHGFGGGMGGTWGNFPSLIKNDEALTGWDIYSIGYNTSLFPDIQGIWSSNPDVTALGGYLRTLLNDRFGVKYQQISIVAHSMGGLVLQRAIIDLLKLKEDSSLLHSVILYGTPSGGLKNARLGRGIHKQVTDMANDSEFIKHLREEWNELIGSKPKFKFLTCAGDLDDFVPSQSSLDPFDVSFHKRVNGNHVDIVKPADDSHLSFKVLRKVLLDDVDFYQGKWDSAEVALELGDFKRAREKFEANKDSLGPHQVVEYAFSLEATGDREAAIKYLEEQAAKSNVDTDILGTLAGRWKRVFLQDLKPEHAEKSIELYQQAYDRALENEDDEQIYYHAINLAFLFFKTKKYKDAKTFAQTAKAHAEKSMVKDVWKYATIAEACLYLEDEAGAYYNYLIALEKEPEVRQRESMYIQWLSVVQQKGLEALERRLRRLFRQL